MKRQTVLLLVLGALLVVSGYWFMFFRAQQEELAQVEAAIVAQEQQQDQLRQEIERLGLVRSQAPEIEAELVAARAVVPEDVALAAAISQLQRAADESGVTVRALSTSRPSPVAESSEQLTGVEVTLQVDGSYFQLVDFFRRVEDPAITPRGLQWTSASINRGEYPALTVSLGGSIYTRAASTPPPAEAEELPDVPTMNDVFEEADVNLPGEES